MPRVSKSVGSSSASIIQTVSSSSSSSVGSGVIHSTVGLLQYNGVWLPPEMLGKICDHLDLKSIVAFTSVCTHLHKLEYPSDFYRKGLLRSQEWKFPPTRPDAVYNLGSRGEILIPGLKLSEGITFCIGTNKHADHAWQQFFKQDPTRVKNICRQVTHLRINPNSSLSLYSKVFNYFSALEHVEFLRKSLKRFHRITWPTALKSIKVQIPELDNFPPGIEALDQLEALEITAKNFFAFPTDFNWPKALKSLVLDMPRLNTLPPGIEALGQLETLEITANHSSAFPKGFNWPTGLKSLKVKISDLDNLPLMEALDQLEALDITAKKSSTFPKGFNWPTGLKSLKVQILHLYNLPLMKALNQLETLDIRADGRWELPAEFTWPIALKSLTFYGAYLGDDAYADEYFIPEMNNFLQLEKLEISLDVRAFSHTFTWPTTLKTLALEIAYSDGHIPTIADLPQLETLKIKENGIVYLEGDFTGLRALKTLRLEGDIVELEPLRSKKLSQLETLEITANEEVRFPERFKWPTALKNLVLDMGHQNTSLPRGIKTLSQLKTLEITAALLDALPDGFTWPPGLAELSLNGNLIKRPESV